MSYFQDKPKRYSVAIDTVENGYTVHIGSGYLGYKGVRDKTFISTKEDLATTVIEVVEQNGKEYEAELKKWEEKEEEYRLKEINKKDKKNEN